MYFNPVNHCCSNLLNTSSCLQGLFWMNSEKKKFLDILIGMCAYAYISPLHSEIRHKNGTCKWVTGALDTPTVVITKKRPKGA